MRLLLISTVVIVALGLTACGSNEPSASPTTTGPTIVAFGDSVTAGYGLSRSESYPARLQERLRADGVDYHVVNAGILGDTSAGGLKRIDRAMEGDVRFVVLALGANDIYYREPVSALKENLAGIIERVKSRGAQVVLAGMKAPIDAVPEYRKAVQEAYRDLARQYEVPFIPSFLDRVEMVESLNLRDGFHPNAKGTKIVAGTVYRVLRPLL